MGPINVDRADQKLAKHNVFLTVLQNRQYYRGPTVKLKQWKTKLFYMFYDVDVLKKWLEKDQKHVNEHIFLAQTIFDYKRKYISSILKNTQVRSS